MKSEKQVKRKLRDVKYKYLAREYKRNLSPCPDNCIYNQTHYVEDVRSEVHGNAIFEGYDPVHHEVRLCMYGAENVEEWGGLICDDEKTAQSCGLFEPRFTKAQIKEAFEDDLKDPYILAHEYKDIAALQWVSEEDASSLELNRRQTLALMILFYLYRVKDFFRKSSITGV